MVNMDINWGGRDWILLRAYLEDMKQKKISLLIGATTQEQSDKLRGALSVIDVILAEEAAAQSRAAN